MTRNATNPPGEKPPGTVGKSEGLDKDPHNVGGGAAMSDVTNEPCVFVTAQRKATEIEGALQRKGVRVEHCPALLTTPVEDDPRLMATTRHIIESSPDFVVVTTGRGLRGWLSAADAEGCGTELRETLRGARIVARGAKALGALRGEKIPVEWVSHEETAADVGRYLSTLSLEGRTVVVQHHGTGSDGLDELIESRGGKSEPVVTYRSDPPSDSEPLLNSIRAAAHGGAIGVLFTSASGSEEWLALMSETDRAQIQRATRTGKTALFAVGDVTAAPLVAAGLSVRVPSRFRLGAVLTLITRWASDLRTPTMETTS